MRILSHRGYWQSPSEKNRREAFERSFGLGYGTETDVRDLAGELVISHDMPAGPEIRFTQMLDMAAAAGPLTLAINIKADGLADGIRRELAARPSLDGFVFDMAVPDMRAYLDAGVPTFTRMSEVERPAWLERCSGVWLDAFGPTWFDNGVIETLLAGGKRVCVVSGELHKRDHQPLWQQLKPLAGRDGLLLCTDFPEEASRFFAH